MTDAGFVTDVVSGRIEIDVSQLRATRDVVVRAAQEMEKAMTTFGATTDQAANRSVGALGRIRDAINDNQKAIGGFALGVTAFGVSSARSVGRTVDQFRILVGEEQKADEWMGQIRQTADETHQAFLPLLEGATSLVPLLRRGNAEFGDTLKLVQQLAASDPAQGAAGATFALREFFSGSYTSLSGRFELSRNELKRIRDEAGDDMAALVAGLSDYLNELGYTQEALIEFGEQGHNAFSILRSEAQETASVFFTPFNDGLNDAAMQLADWLSDLRGIDKELAGILGTMTALVGLTQAANFANMIPGVGSMPGVQGALGTASRVAGYGAAAFGGAQLGVYATRQLGDAGVTGFERFQGRSQQDVLGELAETVGKMGAILILGGAEVVKLMLDIVAPLEEPVNTVVGYLDDLGLGLDKIVRKIDELWPDNAPDLKDLTTGETGAKTVLAGLVNPAGIPLLALNEGRKYLLDQQSSGPDLINTSDRRATIQQRDEGFRSTTSLQNASSMTAEFLNTIGQYTGGIEEYNAQLLVGAGLASDAADAVDEEASAVDNAKQSIDNFTTGLLESLGLLDDNTEHVTAFNAGMQNMAARLGVLVQQFQEQNAPVSFNEDQIKAFGEFQEDIADIETEYEQRRIDELIEYGDRRVQIQLTYQRQLEQMAEDEAVRRARAEENLAENIAGVREREAESLASLDEQHNERMAELRENFHDQEVKAREELNKQLERIERARRISVATAAAHLDAAAVMQANMAANEQKRNAQESYDDAKTQREKQFQEQLEDEQAAYEDRREQTQKNADKQIKDLQEQFRKQERLRAEDYARQLRRMAEQNARELAELDRKHAQTMSKINSAMQAELTAREDGFRDQLNALMAHETDMLGVQTEGLDDLETALQQWYADQVAMFNSTAAVGSTEDNPIAVGASGGPAPSGLMRTSRGEFLLNQQTTRSIRSMLGPSFTQPALLNALSGQMSSGGGRTNIETMAVNFPQTDHVWTKNEMRRFFKEALNDFLSNR